MAVPENNRIEKLKPLYLKMNTLSFWSLVMDGGYIMIPLAVLLIVSIYIFIERCIALHRASKSDETFMNRIKDYIVEG